MQHILSKPLKQSHILTLFLDMSYQDGCRNKTWIHHSRSVSSQGGVQDKRRRRKKRERSGGQGWKVWERETVPSWQGSKGMALWSEKLQETAGKKKSNRIRKSRSMPRRHVEKGHMEERRWCKHDGSSKDWHKAKLQRIRMSCRHWLFPSCYVCKWKEIVEQSMLCWKAGIILKAGWSNLFPPSELK